jgi:hypothetical protein
MSGTSKNKVASYELRVADTSHRAVSPLAARYSLLATRRRPRRRGVLLLVVLSLLVLFLMIGTAFIISTKQSEKGAKAARKAAENQANEAARGNLLDDVLLQLIRDTDNPQSVLRSHSLLGDLYGNDGFQAQILYDPASRAIPQWAKVPSFPDPDPNTGMATSGPAQNMPGGITGGQMIQFDVAAAIDYYGQPVELSALDDAYAGQILTFVSRGVQPNTGNDVPLDCRNISTRIVKSRKYQANNAARWQLTVMAFNAANGTLITNPRLIGDARFVVNGRPFNGTGAGLDVSVTSTVPNDPPVAKLVAAETDGANQPTTIGPIALLPNPVFFNPRNVILPGNATTPANPLLYFSDSAGFANLNAYADSGRADMVGRGSADETYDAADFQNMFLALIPDDAEDYDARDDYFENPDGTPTTIPTAAPSTLGEQILPSFHRPELLHYWAKQLDPAVTDFRQSALATNPVLLRKILLRPNWIDHPLFDGSNLQIPAQAMPGDKFAHMIYGPWDVDNDNDGVRDSVWIDAGLPIIQGPHGRLVKPLVAMLVVDMDGRLNVNAHGSADLAGADPEVADDVPIAGGEESDDTPRGMGWGPADISLEALFDNDGDDKFERLVEGGNGVSGREGPDQDPGRGDMYDVMPQINQFGWSQRGRQVPRSLFAIPPDLRVRYGSAVNALGQLVIEATLDSEMTGEGQLTGDSPYEAALYAEGVDTFNGPQALDAPFSLGELEKILRMFDTDSSALPSRLWRATGGIDSEERNRITTDSWDLPAPNIAMPKELELLLPPLTGTGPAVINPATNQPWRRLPQSTAELLEIRVRAVLNKQDPDNFPLFPVPLAGDSGNAANADPPPPAARLRIIMRQILAPELAAGVRLNVNRPFGNGRDDNGNGVVDEPGEDTITNGFTAWDGVSAPGFAAETMNTAFATAPFKPLDVTFMTDPALGVINDADAMLQRQLLARHLYVMALTMTAPATYFQAANEADTPPAEQAYCRNVAQWAVNVVDFRDADSIMTPFEYDLNPFNGWQPDGDLRYDASVPTNVSDHAGPDGRDGTPDDTFVWGAERPELVMTETLAWHDRRTQDLASEDDYPPTADPQSLTNPNNQDFDPDYDQLVRPRGAFFVEIFNPNAAMPGASADTHDIRYPGGQAYDWGVNLKATDKLTGNSPVWRMAIYKRTPPGSNPFSIAAASLWDPDDRNAQDKDAAGNLQVHRPPVVMDRSVYFTTFDPATMRAPGMWDEDGVAFFAGNAANVGSVRPGRYLVVGGGRDLEGNGVFSSPLGDVVANGDPVPGKPVEWKPRRRIDLSVGMGNNHAVRLVDFKLDGSSVQDTTDLGNPFSVEAPSEADLESTNLGLRFQSGGGPSPASVADIAIIDQVFDEDDGYDDHPNGGDANRTRPLTISEPARGYIDRFINTEWIDSRGYYGNPQQTAIDIPLDGPVVNNARTSDDIRSFLETRVDDNGNSIWSDQYPIPRYLRNADPAVCRVGELSNNPDDDPRVSYAFIYLQRLANPLLPWNPEPGHPAYDSNLQVNPYMTVDRMSADLTVFNGRPQSPPHSPHGYEEDKDSNNGLGTNTNVMAATFSSLERGFHGRWGAPDANYRPSLWFQQRPSLMGPSQNANPMVRRNAYQRETNGIVFKSPPFCTLGFLNKSLQFRAGPPPNDPPDSPEVKAARQQFQPENPHHWLTWNNRPYVSGNELMMVPRVRSSMLMREFSDLSNVDPNAFSPYVPPDNDQVKGDINMITLTRTPHGAFAHVQQFFYENGATPPPPATANPPADGLPTRLYRLLDFVGTPSLFTGATTWLNPATVGLGPAPAAAGNAASAFDDPRIDRQTPFNNVSTFREPGRVNLNTIACPAVYAGIFHDDHADAGHIAPTPTEEGIHPGPLWNTTDDAFVRSRRGASGSSGDILALDDSLPTFFANPFRSANAGDLVPLPHMVRAGVECTLARSTSATASGIDNTPLFAATTPEPYRDMTRNPFFRYEPMVRLNNLTTTRSNVFAVWITVGFFEVEEAPLKSDFGDANGNPPEPTLTQLYDRVYPDGYQFTKEDGLDEGDVRRLRGFYIIDRSRAAGFIPGQDVNAETTIRLHRRIE